MKPYLLRIYRYFPAFEILKRSISYITDLVMLLTVSLPRHDVTWLLYHCSNIWTSVGKLLSFFLLKYQMFFVFIISLPYLKVIGSRILWWTCSSWANVKKGVYTISKCLFWLGNEGRPGRQNLGLSSHFKTFKISRIHSKSSNFGAKWIEVKRRWKTLLYGAWTLQ